MANKTTINGAVCKGCGLCVTVCPKKIIELNKAFVSPKGTNPAHITDMEQCIACGMCAIICPDAAITVEKE